MSSSSSLRALARVRATARGKAVDELLDELAGHDLTTILLGTLAKRARRRGWRDVLDHARRSPAMHASSVDARVHHALTGLLFEAAAEFDAIDLAPVSPAGASSCASVDPNNVLGAVRFAEVAADPAVGLALHAARLRTAGSESKLRLCATQRVLRMQPTTQPGFTPHFRLFALAGAERAAAARRDRPVERALLREQLATWARAFSRVRAEGYRVGRVRIVLSDTRIVEACVRARGGDPDSLARGAKAHEPGSGEARLREAGIELPRAATDVAEIERVVGERTREAGLAEALRTDIGEPLATEHPDLEVVYDAGRLQGLRYYDGPFVQVVVTRTDGLALALGDGGAVRWLGRMLSDERQRLVVTGIGAELLVKLFAPAKERTRERKAGSP